MTCSNRTMTLAEYELQFLVFFFVVRISFKELHEKLLTFILLMKIKNPHCRRRTMSKQQLKRWFGFTWAKQFFTADFKHRTLNSNLKPWRDKNKITRRKSFRMYECNMIAYVQLFNLNVNDEYHVLYRNEN